MHPAAVSAFFSEFGDLMKVAELPSVVKNPEKQSPYGRQLLEGQKIEEEHKDTVGWLKDNPEAPPKAAYRSIAADHLDEDKKYYTHLKEMEDKYKKTAAVMRGRFA